MNKSGLEWTLWAFFNTCKSLDTIEYVSRCTGEYKNWNYIVTLNMLLNKKCILAGWLLCFK